MGINFINENFRETKSLKNILEELKLNIGIFRGPFSYLTQLLVKGEGRLRKLNATSQMSI